MTIAYAKIVERHKGKIPLGKPTLYWGIILKIFQRSEVREGGRVQPARDTVQRYCIFMFPGEKE
jgi:hypothetical protein